MGAPLGKRAAEPREPRARTQAGVWGSTNLPGTNCGTLHLSVFRAVPVERAVELPAWPFLEGFSVVGADLRFEVVSSEVSVCGESEGVEELIPADDAASSASAAALLGPLRVTFAMSSSISVPVHCGHIDSPTANLQPHRLHTHSATVLRQGSR